MPLRLRLSCIRCYGVASLFLLLAGCLYLPIPHWKTTPHKTMRRIVVLDRETRKPLDDAEVVFLDEKWVNWMSPEFSCRWGLDAQTTSPYACRMMGSVAGRRLDPGTFDLPQKTHFCCFHFTCLGLPLGGVLHQTRTGRTIVSAKGYRSVWFSDRLSQVKPADLPSRYRMAKSGEPAPNPVPIQFTPQGVVVSLEKKAQSNQGGAQ